MAEKKSEQKASTKTEKPKQSSEQRKPSQGESAEVKTSGAAKTKTSAKKTTRQVSETPKRAGSGAVGKAAQELGEGVQRTIDKEITPAVERARQTVSETAKKVRPAAEKARKGLAETSRKVGEELGPAAEKAGKGLSEIFKSTARATRKSARILGIKASITAEMRKRQKLLAELGERYFQAQKKKTPSKSDQDALNELVGDIKQVDAEIHTLEIKAKSVRESS